MPLSRCEALDGHGLSPVTKEPFLLHIPTASRRRRILPWQRSARPRAGRLLLLASLLPDGPVLRASVFQSNAQILDLRTSSLMTRGSFCLYLWVYAQRERISTKRIGAKRASHQREGYRVSW